jgi:alpha-L-fucosidase 2
MLGANHRTEALEACRCFERTLEHARRHAWEEFGSPGLKWDWEITHDGRKAYGSLLHMKFQAHNNASYANEIWQYYRYTLDRDALEELYPILEGLATFFLEGIVILTDRGWEIGPLVGVHESPIKVKNEGTSLAGTVAILEHAAEAAALLGKESEFTGEFASRCRAVAAGLRKTLDRLYNGEFFVAAEDMPSLNMSSLAVMYPLGVIPFVDPRAKQTIQKMVEYNDKRSHRDGKYYNFPWSWGVIATILARQGDGAAAWEVIQRTRPTICQFGGMTEVMEGQDWNMQYFGTAQGAVSVALQSLLLQAQGEDIRLFPALPPDWNTASFDSLLAGGLEVHAVYDHSQIHGTVKNISSSEIRRTIVWGNQQQSISLKPGENYAF